MAADDADGNKNSGCESEEQKRKRAAHKQGLQRALASINQLRKEREEFAYPPASVRAREGNGGRRRRRRRRRRLGEVDLWPGVLTRMRRGVRGVFPKRKKRRSCFLNGLNRARMKEEGKRGWRRSQEGEGGVGCLRHTKSVIWWTRTRVQ